MKTNIIVNITIDGIHAWPTCNIPEVDYLRNKHRHVFHICCKKAVSHNDRDIEIICFKHQIENYFSDTYPKQGNSYLLGSTSCEALAEALSQHFGLSYCSVLEDGENGAEVICGAL